MNRRYEPGHQIAGCWSGQVKRSGTGRPLGVVRTDCQNMSSHKSPLPGRLVPEQVLSAEVLSVKGL